MGDRVWQVQKQLEELQARCPDSAEVQAILSHTHKFTKSIKHLGLLVPQM